LGDEFVTRGLLTCETAEQLKSTRMRDHVESLSCKLLTRKVAKLSYRKIVVYI